MATVKKYVEETCGGMVAVTCGHKTGNTNCAATAIVPLDLTARAKVLAHVQEIERKTVCQNGHPVTVIFQSRYPAVVANAQER